MLVVEEVEFIEGDNGESAIIKVGEVVLRAPLLDNVRLTFLFVEFLVFHLLALLLVIIVSIISNKVSVLPHLK